MHTLHTITVPAIMPVWVAVLLWICALLLCAMFATWIEMDGEQPPRSAQTPERCAQRTCGRMAVIGVVSRHTGEQRKVCPGCYDQGMLFGWWG